MTVRVVTERISRRSRSRSAAVALAIAVSAIATEREAHAQDSTAAAPSRRIVEVYVAGAGAEGPELEDTVRELLGRLLVVTEAQLVSSIDVDGASFRSTSRPSLLARVGIDLRAPDAAVVTVVDGRTGDVTSRRSLRREGPSAVIREELAHVVRGAIDPMVLLERERANAASAPRPAPPATSPPPAPVAPPAEPAAVVAAPAATSPPLDRDAVAPEPSSPSAFALDLSTVAGAGAYAPGTGVVPRAGGGAAVIWRRGVRPALGVSGHYIFPFEAGSQPAVAHVSAAALRAMGSLEPIATRSFSIELAAGAGLDVVGVEARSNVLPADRLASPTSRADPVLATAVAGHVAIGGGAAVSLMLAVDVDLMSRRWVVEVDGGGPRTDTFAPSRLRPLAMLGFTFTAFGESRFAAPGGAR